MKLFPKVWSNSYTYGHCFRNQNGPFRGTFIYYQRNLGFIVYVWLLQGCFKLIIKICNLCFSYCRISFFFQKEQLRNLPPIYYGPRKMLVSPRYFFAISSVLISFYANAIQYMNRARKPI